MAKSKIVLPKVAAYFEDRPAGDRVDYVLTQLTSDLQNLRAADAGAIGGTPAAVVGSSGVFFQSFESDVSVSWTRRTDPTSFAYTANGQAGGRALQMVGEGFWEFPENIPFVDDRLYRIRARFRMTAAPADAARDLVSVGVQGFGADGTTLVDTSGGTSPALAHWYAAADVDMGGLTLNTWYTYTGYFSGWGVASTTPSTDADAPRVMDTSVRYIRPCFRLNHAAGDGTMEIDYISLEVLTEGTEANQVLKDAVNLSTGKVATNKVVTGSITNDAITTAKIDAGAVDTDQLAANAVTAAKIQAGTITASEIAAGTITADKISSGTITATQIAADTLTANEMGTLSGAGLTINFNATAGGNVLSHSGFSLTEDGNATFGGALSAATGSFSGSLSAASGTFTGDLQSGTVNVKDGGGTTRLIITSVSNAVINAPGTGLTLQCAGNTVVSIGSNQLSFFGAASQTKQSVTGSRGGNAALASLLSKLSLIGLITDSTSA